MQKLFEKPISDFEDGLVDLALSPNREEALFAQALTKPASERPSWLDLECSDDKAASGGVAFASPQNW